MALIGGLAAATLVNASLVIAVVVSLVIGAVGVVFLFRSPAREPELTAPRTATIPRTQPHPGELSRTAPPPEPPTRPTRSPRSPPRRRLSPADGLNRGARPP